MKNKAACDRIFIRKLKIPAIIGIHDFEKSQYQDIFLDLDFEYAASQAAFSDNIGDALDYAAICKFLSDYIPTTRFALIEKLAEDVSRLLFSEFPISGLKMKIFKKPFDIKNARFVGLCIERKKNT